MSDDRNVIGAIDAGSISFKLDAPAVRIPIGADAVIAFGQQVQAVCVSCGQPSLCLPVRIEGRPPGRTDWCGPCLADALTAALSYRLIRQQTARDVEVLSEAATQRVNIGDMPTQEWTPTWATPLQRDDQATTAFDAVCNECYGKGCAACDEG